MGSIVVAFARIRFGGLVPVAPCSFRSERAGPVVIGSAFAAASRVASQAPGVFGGSASALRGYGCDNDQLVCQLGDLLGPGRVEIRALGRFRRKLGETLRELGGAHGLSPGGQEIGRCQGFVTHPLTVRLESLTRGSIGVLPPYSGAKGQSNTTAPDGTGTRVTRVVGIRAKERQRGGL